MSPKCANGLNEEQAAFLNGLEQFFKSWPNQRVANQFEVTMGIAMTKAKVVPEEDYLFPIERDNPHVFVMLVGDEARVKRLAEESAGAAADPCCWWVFIGGRLICVAMC